MKKLTAIGVSRKGQPFETKTAPVYFKHCLGCPCYVPENTCSSCIKTEKSKRHVIHNGAIARCGTCGQYLKNCKCEID